MSREKRLEQALRAVLPYAESRAEDMGEEIVTPGVNVHAAVECAFRAWSAVVKAKDLLATPPAKEA